MEKKEKLNKQKSDEVKITDEQFDFIYYFLSGMLMERVFKIFEVEGKEGETHGKGKSKVKRKKDSK